MKIISPIIDNNKFNRMSFKKNDNGDTVVKKSNKNEDTKKIAITSSAFSIGAILLSLYALSKAKTKKTGKAVKMFSMHLHEGDIFALGASTVIGATAGGIIVDDNKYKKAKIREASHQIIGNIAAPLAFIWGFNKGVEKLNIKLPKIKGTSKQAKAANFALEILPNLITTCAGLYAGINVGNVISNKINDNIFGKKDKKREVKIADYCIHIDDPITVLTLADKSGKIKAFTGKVMPFVFILSGYQSGMARE